MSLSINPTKQTGGATSEVNGHQVTFHYEYLTGEKPAYINASGTNDEGPVFSVGVAYASGNVNISLYSGANKDVDLESIATVLEQIKEVYDQI